MTSPVDAAVVLLDGGDEDGWRLAGLVVRLGELELHGAHEQVTLVVAHVHRHALVELPTAAVTQKSHRGHTGVTQRLHRGHTADRARSQQNTMGMVRPTSCTNISRSYCTLYNFDRNSQIIVLQTIN